MGKIKKKPILLFVIAIVALYAIIYIIPSVTGALISSYTAEYGELKVSDETTGYIVRNETVYLASSAGELVYKDDGGAVCRCWTWREAKRTMLTEETKNAMLCCELIDLQRWEDFLDVLECLKRETEEKLGGKAQIKILDIDHPGIRQSGCRRKNAYHQRISYCLVCCLGDYSDRTDGRSAGNDRRSVLLHGIPPSYRG